MPSLEPRDEDDLAFLRDEREFRNVQLVEIENGDFAVTMARQLIFSRYQYELYSALLDLHRPDAVRAGRQGGQGGRLPPRPRHPMGAPARRRHPGIPRPDAGRTGPGLALCRGDLRQPRTPSPRCPASPPTRPRSARPGPIMSRTSRRGDTDRPDPEVAVPRRPHRLPQREPGAPAARDAEPAPFTPRSDLVTVTLDQTAPVTAPVALTLQRLREIAGSVPDPEIPVLTLHDLGILRDVQITADGVCRCHADPDLHRLPGDGGDRRRRRNRPARSGCRPAAWSAPCCRRRGRPTG